MRCKFCGSPFVKSECLPTDAGGAYSFMCGTTLETENGEGWLQSKVCRKTVEVRATKKDADHA